jgi:hypothetical protein
MHLELRISPQIFEKNLNGPNGALALQDFIARDKTKKMKEWGRGVFFYFSGSGRKGLGWGGGAEVQEKCKENGEHTGWSLWIE